VVAGLATGESITNPDAMFEKAGVELIKARADCVDAETREIHVADGRRIPYDKLILGIGSSPFVPPLEGKDLQGVFALRTLSDAEAIRSYIDAERPRRLVFIGAGFISLELAAMLADQRPGELDISVIELLEHPLPLMLGPEFGGRLKSRLEEKGLVVRTGRKVQRILGEGDKVAEVELDGGQRLAADMVLLNVGVRANTELAERTGLAVGRHGIKVNEFLETSDPHILAAGDCVEKPHFITGKPVPGQLRGPAVIQGRLAAKRLAGHAIPFPGVLDNSVVRLFEIYAASVGMTEEAAEREGFATISASVDSRSKHGMIEGVKPWSLKLVFDRESARLLGGQILSEDTAPVKEIDTINALILGGKTIQDLTVLMCAGNPDCSSEPSLEPITIAAEQALHQLVG
jgi:NADH oxidase (H2O2-forming)